MGVMEPVGENRPTMETAREVGRQRLDKVLNFVAPIFAPETMLQVGKEAAKEKQTGPSFDDVLNQILKNKYGK